MINVELAGRNCVTDRSKPSETRGITINHREAPPSMIRVSVPLWSFGKAARTDDSSFVSRFSCSARTAFRADLQWCSWSATLTASPELSDACRTAVDCFDATRRGTLLVVGWHIHLFSLGGRTEHVHVARLPFLGVQG